jgi:hypothetical protein
MPPKVRIFTFHRPMLQSSVEVDGVSRIGTAIDLCVRDAHPCKLRKDGAPSFVMMSAKPRDGPPARSPVPTPKCDSPPTGITPYEMVRQTIYVGSDTAGAGVVAQTDFLTYYLDQGADTTIVLPPPPPQ